MYTNKLVIIFAMRSWGERGNLLSARLLADALELNCQQSQIEVVEAELFFPLLAKIGGEIETISRSNESIPNKLKNYHKLMETLEECFPEENEISSEWHKEFHEGGKKLSEFLDQRKPEIIVGTKGIISRMLYKSVLKSAYSPLVISYVTNEGLAELSIHRSKYIPLTIVPFERIRSRLVNHHNYEPDRVFTAGKLIPKSQTTTNFEANNIIELPKTRQRMIVLSIRSGMSYLNILKYLSDNHREIGVLFISLNDDPQLLKEASDLSASLDLNDKWVISSQMSQGSYISALKWLQSCESPIFISKTGPNTMFEAASNGIAQLLLRSGLPQEEWVVDYLKEKGIGFAFDNIELLIQQLDIWLRDAELVKTCCEQAVLLHSEIKDDKKAQLNLGRLFQSLLSI